MAKEKKLRTIPTFRYIFNPDEDFSKQVKEMVDGLREIGKAFWEHKTGKTFITKIPKKKRR